MLKWKVEKPQNTVPTVGKSQREASNNTLCKIHILNLVFKVLKNKKYSSNKYFQMYKINFKMSLEITSVLTITII